MLLSVEFLRGFREVGVEVTCVERLGHDEASIHQSWESEMIKKNILNFHLIFSLTDVAFSFCFIDKKIFS
jgi:hypothetical protein